MVPDWWFQAGGSRLVVPGWWFQAGGSRLLVPGWWRARRMLGADHCRGSTATTTDATSWTPAAAAAAAAAAATEARGDPGGLEFVCTVGSDGWLGSARGCAGGDVG